VTTKVNETFPFSKQKNTKNSTETFNEIY
jgi:hypothetical protein